MNLNEQIKVGEGATIKWYSDRTACTIIEVGKNYIKVQQDKATRIDNNGMSDAQEYVYERDNKAPIYTFKKCRKSKYDENDLYTDNGKRNDYGSKLIIGIRREYYDYTF